MRVFFISMGWNVNHVIGCLTRNGLDSGDYVFLIIPEIVDKRSLEAIDRVKAFIDSVSVVVNFDLVKVPIRFRDAVDIVLHMLNRFLYGDNRIIINISGGMRFVVLIVYTAFLMLDNKRNVILDALSLEGQNQVVSLEVPPLVKYEAKDVDRKILNFIGGGEYTLDDIADSLDMAKPNVWKYLDGLSKLGVIRIKRLGNRNYYSVSGWV